MHRHPNQPKTVKGSAAAARQQQQTQAPPGMQESDTEEFEAEAKQHSG